MGDKKKNVARSKEVPEPVISRLTKYLTCSQVWLRDGKEWVTSLDLAEQLNIAGTTIRRDLSHLNVGGITNKGYNTKQLCNVLVSFLGADLGWKALVVGAGNLGKALTLHGDLARQGFKICAVFDTDGRKVGARIGDLVVKAMEELPWLIVEEGIHIGIIAVPFDAAQSVADIMIVSGIKGIFNLSLTHVVVPGTVQIVEGRLVAGMLELGYAVKTKSASA